MNLPGYQIQNLSKHFIIVFTPTFHGASVHEQDFWRTQIQYMSPVSQKFELVTTMFMGQGQDKILLSQNFQISLYPGIVGMVFLMHFIYNLIVTLERNIPIPWGGGTKSLVYSFPN